MRSKWIALAIACGALVLTLVAAKPSDEVVRHAVVQQLRARFPDEAFRRLVATRLAAREAARLNAVFRSEAGQEFLVSRLQDSSEVRAVTDRVRESVLDEIQSSLVHRMDLCWGIYLNHETQYVDVDVEAHYGIVRVRERWLHLLSERSPLDRKAQRRFISFPDGAMAIVDRALDEEQRLQPEVPGARRATAGGGIR